MVDPHARRGCRPPPYICPMDPQLTLAEAVRQACLDALLEAYEDAGVQGLCAEGRLEAAVGAVRSLDLKPLIQKIGD